MDEIEKRLRDATDACITTYDAWRKNAKDGTVRENLMEAVHELRKVAARLEIEMAISERDEMAARPIPIPPHRSSRRQGNNGDFPADDNIGNVVDNNGNSGGGGFSGHGGGQHRGHGGGPRRGGGGGGGGQRRHGGGEGGGKQEG